MDVPHLDEALPVSALQEGMWLLEHLEGGQPLVRSALRISGRVDVGRLAGSIEAVIARHELLRCGFRSDPGKVRRFEARGVHARVLHVIDLRRVAAGDAQQCVDFMQSLLEPLRLPLDAPPLMRLCLVQVAAEDWVLWTAIHHIVCDEHSNNILCNEILTAYAGRAFSRPAERFTDFLQRREPPGRGASDREFWRKVVAECDSAAALQAMSTRSATAGPAKTVCSISQRVSVADEARIRQLCRVLRCTPAVLFLGALQIWLARSAGGKPPPVCVPMQLRDDLEESPMVGFLTNLVVIPTQWSDTDTVLSFFQKLSKRFYDTWSHRHTPFGEVSSLYSGERRSPVHPLSRYLFALETAPEVLQGGADLGLQFETLRTQAVIPGSAFGFIVTRGAVQTSLRVQYDPGATASGWAESALPHILHILGELSTLPNTLLDNTRMGGIGLRADTVNPALQPRPPRRTVYQRFQEVSGRLADRPAVYSTRGQHSFADLASRVDALTGLLLRERVGAGDLVGLTLQRGPDLVALQIAVLRLGAGYVPLSADWPQPVLARITAQLECVITDETLEDVSTTLPVGFVAAEVAPAAIAYVLYTSGSTGEPKGVAVSHESLECYMDWSETYFGDPQDIVVYGCTPIIFDMSISEVLIPACTGMRTLLVNRAAEAHESPYWDEVTWITGVPTVLRELLKATALPRAIRTVSFGGEELDRSTVERVRRSAPEVRILNLYGPTEVTVYATGAELAPGESDPVPIGAPLRFHSVRILDSALNELPDWAVGQLAVGGCCVAQGYLNAPDTTADRFVPDPFAGAGARMHLTGDLGFRDGQGHIQLVGRVDSQEKILGVRIHLGGVEALLRRHPQVADAACFVINKGSAAAHLAAALVAHTTQTPPPDEFRAWLQRACAASHVPRQWAWFERLPTRPGGKVDRATAHAQLEAALRDKREQTLTSEEGAVLAVWRHVLEAPVADVDVNFFDAGGNSLHLPRLCLELRATGLALELSQLFEYPTVRAQAGLLKLQRRDGKTASSELFELAARRGEWIRHRLAGSL